MVNLRKKERHQLIKQLLIEKVVQKQEDFVVYLQEKGISVTQATISRDIKELKIIKVPAQTGGYRYSMPNEQAKNTEARLKKLLQDALISVDQMEKYVILHTIPGNAAASSTLIQKNFKQKIFSAINDDTGVLIIARSEVAAEWLKQKFIQYI